MLKLIHVISLLILFVLYGCNLAVPHHIKKEYKYPYKNVNSGLDTLIKIDGFYYPQREDVNLYKDRPLPMDNVYPCFFFYSNGFVYPNRTVNPHDILTFNGSKSNISYGDCGSYIVQNDIIKLQYINPSLGMSRYCSEIWFKIIDDETLLEIFPIKGSKYIFYPYDENLNINNAWIINKRWFWNDRESYYKWKKTR